ncbi:MAG: hypothetical protein ABSE89_12325, partial [Sedimentisphaerales bacterium]
MQDSLYRLTGESVSLRTIYNVKHRLKDLQAYSQVKPEMQVISQEVTSAKENFLAGKTGRQ